MARLNRSKLDGDDRPASDLSTAEPTESTRLLGASVEESRNEAVTEDTNGGWDGLADFDGLPWWRRPSVSVNGPLPDHFPVNIMGCRYFGYWHHIRFSPSLLGV